MSTRKPSTRLGISTIICIGYPFLFLSCAESVLAQEDDLAKTVNDPAARTAIEHFNEQVGSAGKQFGLAIERAKKEAIGKLEAAKRSVMQAGDLPEANRVDSVTQRLRAGSTTQPSPTTQPKVEEKVNTAPLFRGQKHTYLIVNSNVTWFVAKQRCEEMGGMLASVSDRDVLQLLHAHTSGEEVWVGASRGNSRNYVWCDGSPVDRNVWRKNEPSFGKESVALLLTGGDGINDVEPDHQATGFICEWNDK